LLEGEAATGRLGFELVRRQAQVLRVREQPDGLERLRVAGPPAGEHEQPL
jgi:hypothetical protein